MPAVCFYFQLHQPDRLRRYSVFDAASDYFDDTHNAAILRKVASKSYLPGLRRLHELAVRMGGDFRLALSVTGSLIEQCRRWSPEVIEWLEKLAETGCVEFLTETSHHSLSHLFSDEEFDAQIALHVELMDELFGQRPTVFRNTELIYNDALATRLLEDGRFLGVLCEGADAILQGRSANHVYRSGAAPGLSVLLKNHRLSDDIAFRFSDPSWAGYPLTAEKYAGWIVDEPGDVVGLFMDFETFGEHQWEPTGIFDFLSGLPRALMDAGVPMLTPSEVLDECDPQGSIQSKSVVSWADTERDASAWLGNAMQTNAAGELYKLESAIKQALLEAQDGHRPSAEALLRDWRKLTTSDHFYYMCTKYYADGEVHKYFSPYASPYDAYINFMNVLDHLRTRAQPVALA
ncbi:MAG: glycoside hydrolase family 57 protein [Planctomycetota bacterium]